MRDRLKSLLSGLPEINADKLYIWGAGNTTQLYLEGFARIPELNIAAFVDNDPAKQGNKINGIPVISAHDMVCDDGTLVLISTAQPAAFTAIKAQLNGLGVRSEYIDAALWSMFRDELMEVFDALDDERSKEIYLKMLECRVNCVAPDVSIVSGDEYFPAPYFCGASGGETFIDCGAFVGDSVERYIWAHEGIFGRIIAFEPDAKNFKAMCCRAERLKNEWNADGRIELLPYAVGEKDSTLYVERYDNNNGLGSKMSDAGGADSDECRTVALGSYITGSGFFVKADIESYEYKMLLGARDAICRYKPKLAICIYHNAVDFFSIPLLIKSFAPEYKLSVRQHSYCLADTVLYAYV